MSSRRQTLGIIDTNRTDKNKTNLSNNSKRMSILPTSSVSSSSNNKRLSIAPQANRMSLAPQSNRLSLAPDNRLSLDNRKSMGGSDNRKSLAPTSSKPYDTNLAKENFKSNMTKLADFLIERNYDGVVTSKTLLGPSDKEFAAIQTFLINLCDPCFKLPPLQTKEWMEKVILFYKFLGAPFNLSKSIFTSVGAGHTWCNNISYLTWLIEVIKFDEYAEITDANVNFEFNLISASYPIYLSQADDEDKDTLFLNKEIDIALNNQTVDIKAEIKSIEDSTSSIVKTILKIEEENPTLEVLELEHTNLLASLTSFSETIVHKKNEIQNLESLLKDHVDEYKSTESELKDFDIQITTLTENLKIQDASLPDITRMMKEKELIETTVLALNKQFVEIDKRKSDLTNTGMNKLSEITLNISKFNELSKNLGLSYDLKVKFIEDFSYLFSCNSLELVVSELAKLPLSEFINLNLNTVEASLKTMKDDYATQVKSLSKESREVSRKLREVSEKAQDKQLEVDSLTTRFEKIDASYRADREVMNSDLRALVSSVEDLELSLREIQSVINNKTDTKSESMIQSEKLEIQQNVLMKTIEDERDALEKQVLSMVSAATKSKMAITAKLEETKKKIDKMKNAVN